MTTSYKSLGLVFGYSIVLLASKGLTLLVSILVALSVDDAEFGYFSLAQALFVTAISMFGFNSSAAYVRYYYDKGAATVFFALRRVNCFFFVVAAFFSLLLYFVFSWHQYYVWFSLLPVSGLLAAHVVSFNAIYRCSNDLVGYAIAELGRPVLVFFVVSVALFVSFDLSIVAVYLVVLFSSLVVVFLISGARLRFILCGVERLPLAEREAIFYLLPLVMVQLMTLLNNVGDRYILTAFVTVEELGQYAKAYLAGSAVGMLVDSLSLLWGPYVVKRVSVFKSDLYPRTLMFFWGAILLSILFLLLAIVVFVCEVSLFSIEHDFLVMVVVVLSAFVARVGYQIMVPVLSAFDFTRSVAKISLWGAILGVSINFLLIPFIGALGAAIATWVSFVTFSILSLYVVQKKIMQV